MINPPMIFKLKNLQQRFVSDHPKFPAFLQAVMAKGLTEGTVLALSVTDPEGHTIETNIKLTQNDIDAYHELMSMSQKQ